MPSSRSFCCGRTFGRSYETLAYVSDSVESFGVERLRGRPLRLSPRLLRPARDRAGPRGRRTPLLPLLAISVLEAFWGTRAGGRTESARVRVDPLGLQALGLSAHSLKTVGAIPRDWVFPQPMNSGHAYRSWWSEHRYDPAIPAGVGYPLPIQKVGCE